MSTYDAGNKGTEALSLTELFQVARTTVQAGTVITLVDYSRQRLTSFTADDARELRALLTKALDDAGRDNTEHETPKRGRGKVW